MLNRILKYVPVALIVLLLVAWVLNFFGQFGIGLRPGKHDYHIAFRSGSVSASQHDNNMIQGLFYQQYPRLQPDIAAEVGSLSSLSARLSIRTKPEQLGVGVPIVLIITLLLPFAIGAFTGFRFKLWQLFAFTTIVAVQLVYFTHK
jgi:hypothetical protein